MRKTELRPAGAMPENDVPSSSKCKNGDVVALAGMAPSTLLGCACAGENAPVSALVLAFWLLACDPSIVLWSATPAMSITAGIV